MPDVSQRLAAYLDDPLVQRDDRLRLRALVVEGNTDVNLDPMLAERSWREALELAEKLLKGSDAVRAPPAAAPKSKPFASANSTLEAQNTRVSVTAAPPVPSALPESCH